MSADRSAVRYRVVDGIGHLTLARADRGNALDQTTLDELSDAVDEAAEDRAVRCLLVTAEGRWFSTGGDLRSLGASREGAPAFVRRAATSLNSMVSRLARATAPVVVATGGPAIGAGVAFACIADVVIATERASFMAGYPAIAMTPDAGISWFLPRRVGSRAASAYFLRNLTWTAREALELGLVSEIVPEDQLEARALDVAREIAQGSTGAQVVTRELLLSATELSLEQQLEREAGALAAATRTDDGWRGISEMLAGTTPTFGPIHEETPR